MDTLQPLVDDFELLDEWEDRYRYVIELGRGLPELSELQRCPQNKVQGCVSQVWLDTTVEPGTDAAPVLRFAGDSDAHIVRGLIAILFRMYSGQTAKLILATDALSFFQRIGLDDHLTPQRSNGLRSMVDRIRRDAQNALSETTV
jgi:cysteine desulfuration protein SufE